jgi:signal transduction histidine kinase
VGSITQQHDLRLVVLAGILCLFACATAMSLVQRARAGDAKLAWLAAASLVAGCGIWATHFVAMLAYRPGFSIAYDPTLTALSVVIAILLCGVGFAIALSKVGPLLGGAVAGGAIGTMHYVGMAAVRVPAAALWDWRYVLASAVIGIAAMSGGMRLVMRGDNWKFQSGGAVIFTLAICSMHFTGMSAVTYRLDPRVSIPGAVLEPGTLAIAVAAIAILIVALGLVGSLVNDHLSSRAVAEAARMRRHILDLEATRDRLERTSENLRVALDAAAAADKAKSAFLAAMSHELRTPLNAVIGFSDMLLMENSGTPGGTRGKDYLKSIHASGQHLLTLINDILDVASINAGEHHLNESDIALSDLVTACLRTVTPQAKAAKVSILHDIEAGIPLIRADGHRLKQVLINVLGNAVKFTPPGGEVHLQARWVTDGGHVVTVRDTGIGMAEQDIAVARERFGQVDSRLSRKYEGAGLGLPIAIALVELHGGALHIESTLGAGTTVTISFPPERVVSKELVLADAV